MANGANVAVNLTFTADTGKVRSQLQDLSQQLQKITSSSLTRDGSFKGFSAEINEATKAASQLQAQLQSCTNVNTGKLDLTKFTQSLQSSGIKLSDYANKLSAIGPAGAQAFSLLAQAIGNAEIPLRKSSGMLANFAANLKKVAQWQISSSVIHGFMGSLQSAYGYAQDLNASLNDIRIVTGQSIEQMDAFAKKANEAAKALSTTTNNYAKASLIFYQQGLGDADVKARTDAVMKMVNVTKDSAEEVSSYMTAIWNNFDDGAKSLEHYADVMTALGAATASSTAEIAAGLEKFASIGDTIGLSYEYATSALATIVAQTRQSSEVVGNGLRTIFSRLQGLKLGETLDDGVSLNKYSQALSNVGVQILDAAGNMKNMDTILDDLASKWTKLSKAQQTALAQTVGGVRQYTTLISLMDNWKSMEQNLMTAESSSGALQAQQDIYAESWKAAADEVRAAWEGVWQVMVDDDFFISMLNGIEKVITGVHTLIDSMGGLKGVMSGMGVLVTSIFGKDMIASIDRFTTSLQYKASGGDKAAIQTKIDANNAMMSMYRDSGRAGGAMSADGYKIQGEAQNLLIANAEKMNAVEQENARILLEQIQARTQLLVAAGEQAEKEEKIAEKSKKTIQNLLTMPTTTTLLGSDGISNIKNQLNELNKLQSQYSTLAPTANSIGAILDSAFGTPGEKIKAITSHMEELEKKFANLGDAPDHVTAAMEKMNQALKSGDIKQITAAYDELTKSMTTMEVDITKTENALKALKNIDISKLNLSPEQTAVYQELIKAIDDYIAAERRKAEVLQDGAQHQSEAEAALERYKQLLTNLKTTTKTFGEAVVGTMRGISSILMGLNSLSSIKDILSDDSLSGWQKFSKVLLSVSMGLPMLISGFKALNLEALKNGAATVAASIGQLAYVGAGKAVTAVLGAQTAATLGLNAAITASPIGWFFGVLAGAAAILTGVTIGIVALYNALNAPTEAEKKLEETKKAAEDLAEGYNKAKESYNALMQDVNKYESVRDQLNSCTAGTEEWRDATIELDSVIQGLLTKYPELAKYGKNIGEGLKELQDKAELHMKAAELGSSFAANDAAIQNYNTNRDKYSRREQLQIEQQQGIYFELMSDQSRFDELVMSFRRKYGMEGGDLGKIPAAFVPKDIFMANYDTAFQRSFSSDKAIFNELWEQGEFEQAALNLMWDYLAQEVNPSEFLDTETTFSYGGWLPFGVEDLIGENDDGTLYLRPWEEFETYAKEKRGYGQTNWDYTKDLFNFYQSIGSLWAVDRINQMRPGETGFEFNGYQGYVNDVLNARYRLYGIDAIDSRRGYVETIANSMFRDSDETNDYLGEVAVNAMLQAVESKVNNEYANLSGRDIIKKIYGNDASISEKDGKYTYTDASGVETAMDEVAWRHVLAWEDVYPERQKYYTEAEASLQGIRSSPILQNYADNLNFDTATIADLQTLFGITDVESISAEKVSHSLLKAFNYPDLDSLARALGFDTNTPGADLTRDLVTLVEAAYNAPEEAVKQLSAGLSAREGFSSNVQAWLENSGSNLTFGQYKDTINLLNTVNTKGGIESAVQLFGVMQTISPNSLPDFLTKLTSIDWNNLGSMSDLSSLFKGTEFETIWSTFVTDFLKSTVTKGIGSLDMAATVKAAAMSGSKAGDTISKEDYDSLIDSTDIESHVIQTGDDEYTFIDSFVPKLTEAVAEAETLHKVLQKNAQTWDNTAEGFIPWLKGAEGQELIKALGIESLTEADYQNADYMEFIKKSISDAFLADSSYNSDYAKSLVYSTAQNENELKTMIQQIEGIESLDQVVEGSPAAKALALIRNTAEETTESFNALTTSATTALSILQNLSFGSSVSSETYSQLIDYNNELADSFVQLADGSYRFIGSSSDIDNKIKTLIQSYDTIKGATIKDDFSSESNLAKYADKKNLGAADLKALELAGYTPDEVAQLIKSKDEKAIAAFNAAMQQVFATKPKELIASMATSIGQLGSYTQTYGLGASEVKAQGQYLMSQATTLDELKAMQTELTTGETFKSLNIATTDLTNGYVAGLLNIANGYASCKDEVKAYYEAVAKGDTAGISAAQTNLENAIALEDLATQYNTTTQAILAYKAIAGSTVTDQDAAKAIAKAKSISALNKEYSDLVELGNSINTDDNGNDILTSILGDSEDFEAFVQAQEYFSDVFGKEITSQNTADLLQALDDEEGFKTLAKNLGMTEELANSLWTSLTAVEVDPFQQATDTLSQAATKLSNSLAKAKAEAEKAKTVFDEMINVLSDKDAKKSMSYLEGLRDLGLSSTASSSEIAKKYLDLQKEAIFKTKLNLANMFNEEETAFKDSAISLDSIVNLKDTKELSAKLREIFKDDDIANVAKEYFDTLYSETGSYIDGTAEQTTQGLINYLKSHNQDLTEEWENFISGFVDSLTAAAQAQLQIEQEAAQETANAWIKAYQAINAAREGLAKGTSIIETLRGDTEALEAFITTALKAEKNANQILTALASSSSTDWVNSMTPTWSLKTQATGADITSQFLFNKEGQYKGVDGEALVDYTTWATAVDNWVNGAFKSVDQLTAEQKTTYGITDDMVSDIDAVKTRIKEYYRGTGGTDANPTEEYRNAQAAIIAAEGQHVWDELESKMTIAKNTRDTAMAKAETEAKKNASIAKAVQALIDRDEDSDETLKEIISSSGATQEEFISLINEKYGTEDKQYTIDTVEEAIANGTIDLATVLAEAESKRDTAYSQATSAATTYAGKFDGQGELAKLAGTQYEIEADSTVRTATLNQEAGVITGGKDTEKTVDAFTASLDRLKVQSSNLADDMATLNGIDVTKMPREGTKAYNLLSQALTKANKTMSDFQNASGVQRAKMLADAQNAQIKAQLDNIDLQMAEYESKYQFTKDMTEDNLVAGMKQDEYDALQAYLTLKEEKEQLNDQYEEVENNRIAAETQAYESAYTALENRFKTLQAKVEDSKAEADALAAAIETGELSATQRGLFEINEQGISELDAWDKAASAVERAAIAAKTFSSYADEASNAASEMKGIYEELSKILNVKDANVIGSKEELIQSLGKLGVSEEAVGAAAAAFERLVAAGDTAITMADISDEIARMTAELQASSDEATSYAADQIKSVYTNLAQANIEAAEQAVEAWKKAFQEIASARDKLLKGEDLLADVASNPELLLTYFKNYVNKSQGMESFAQDIISGKITANDLKSPVFDLNAFLAPYGLNLSSGTNLFGRTSVAADQEMVRAVLSANNPNWSGMKEEAQNSAIQQYVEALYSEILQGNGLDIDTAKSTAALLYSGNSDYNTLIGYSTDLATSIVLAHQTLQDALTQRNEAESALAGTLKTKTATETTFNGKTADEETLNALSQAIANADEIKEQGGKWEDLAAADKALLESFGITNFENLSSQALGCANALAALAGAALAAAEGTAQQYGFYKNKDGVYEAVVDESGNIVTTGAFNENGTLKNGYTWSGNKDQALTDQINTLQKNADAATYTATDAGTIEALYGTEARMAGFDDAADQTNFIDYATQAGELHDLTEIMESYNVESKEAEKIQRKLANAMKKREIALKKAIDQGEELVKTANSETAANDDKKDAIMALRSMYEDVLGPMDQVSDEFVKNTTNMKNFQKAAEGDEKALNALQASYVEALAGVDFGPELDALAAEVAAWDPGDLEVGATINDTDFLAKCAELVNKAGLTADQASDALSAMGVDAKITPHEVTIGEGGSTFVEATGGIYVPKVSDKGVVTYEYAAAEGGYEIKGQPGETMTYYTIEGAKYNGKGVTGDGVGNRRGGGGGGSREARRANRTTMKPKRYHKIDNHIDNLTDAYERLNKQEDRAWGKDRIAAMEKVSQNLKDQVTALRAKRKEAEKYLAKDKKEAEKYGFIFDETTGDVSNYKDVIRANKKKYNDAVNAYNAMSAEQQEALDKQWKEQKNSDGEYYSDYLDYLDQMYISGPQEALEAYEETMETWEQLGLDIGEKLDELYDIMVEAITYRMEFGMNITEEQLKLIEHRLKKIEDNAYNTAAAIAAEADKMNLHQQNYKLAYQQVDDLLKAHNPDWSVEDWMNGKISNEQLLDAGFTQQEIDAIQTSVETMMESVEGMTESMTASYEHMTNAFEEFNEDLERYSNAIEHAQSVTSSYRNILDLTGRSATGFTAELMNSFNANVVSQAKAGLTAAQQIQKSAEQQYQMAFSKFEEAKTLYKEGSPEWLAAQAAFEAAEDNLQAATENFMAAWEAALQAVADAYRSNMEAAMEDISKKMANGLAGGLEALDTRYNRMKTLNDNYVDDYEKIYQLTKLTRDLETQIDNTSNVRAQKELLKFQKEINGILQSDKKLSEYDIDYLQKKYDLKLAEIALEDTQNAKSQVTMRRDSEGNYNYVYTADEGAVAEAEAEYATKLYEMQKANDEYITQLEASMISLEQEMLNAMLELDPSQFASQEEYMAAIKEIEDFYLAQMNIYSEQLNNVIANNQALWDNDMKWFNEHYGYKIADAKTFVTDWNETMLGQASGFATAEDFFSTFESSLSAASTAAVTAYKTFREDMDAINAQAGHPTETFAESVTNDLKAITNAAEQASEDIGKAVGKINTAIASIGDKITETANVYKQQIEKMEQDTEQLALAVISLLTASGASISVTWTQGQASNIQDAKEDAENDKHYDGTTPPVGLATGGYTGVWGSEGRLAFLHQKELVLNAEDTANILTSVGILRQIANVIDLNALTSAGGFISLMSSGVRDNKETLQQEVHIEAHFPNATDKNQIEDAFKDIVNLAAQYANRSSF